MRKNWKYILDASKLPQDAKMPAKGSKVFSINGCDLGLAYDAHNDVFIVRYIDYYDDVPDKSFDELAKEYSLPITKDS